MDLWVVDIRRFSSLHDDRDWVRDRTLEAYGKHYTIAYPHEEYESGRPRIVSPLYERLKSAGRRVRLEARLGAAELVRAAMARMRRDVYSMGRQNWFAAVGARASSGARAGRPLRPVVLRQIRALRAAMPRRRCPGSAPTMSLKPPGRLTYTQMLNSRGGIECDLTVARLAEDHFYIVTGTGFRTHDVAWIGDHIEPGARCDAHRRDRRVRHAVADGPEARDILAAVTAARTSRTQAFPFGHVRIDRDRRA